MLRFAAVVFLSSIISGCAIAPSKSAEPRVETRVDLDEAGRIVYIGSITNAAVEKTKEIYAGAEVTPEVLAITSSGGDVVAGLDLGEWILEHELAIEVEDFCASSCANYIFVAGRVKRLHRNSILLWHGSLWQKSLDGWEDVKYRGRDETFAELRERESAFFNRAGVDNLITTNDRKLTMGDRLRWLIRRPTQGFDYDLEDMRRMGVTNIYLVDGEWDWRKERSFPVRRVSLGDDYEFTLSRFQDPVR